MPGPNNEALPGEFDPVSGTVVPFPDADTPADPPSGDEPMPPTDPPVEPTDPPADPPVEPPVDPPAPKGHTIGDDLTAVEATSAEAKADADALVAATDKAKASAAKAVEAREHFAADLKKIGGDTFKLNSDGSATAYYVSATSPDGYTTEILKPLDTVVTEDA